LRRARQNAPFEAEAARILDEAGMTDRVTRRFLDIAQEPDAVVPADVVVLHRVVCCYPDYATLLSAAVRHARRALAYSHPPVNVVNRVQFGTENAAPPGLDRRASHKDQIVSLGLMATDFPQHRLSFDRPE
jgi:hypothetical protein